MSEEDRKAVMDIFNHYIENSFAAYPESSLPYEAYDMFLHISKGYPSGVIRDKKGMAVGFGMLRMHNPLPAFSRTADATYFIHPDHTGNGLGKMMLKFLEQGASIKGVKIILASISSLNPQSISFHLKNGFVECGRFRKVGTKKDKEFDTVWMQKML